VNVRGGEGGIGGGALNWLEKIGTFCLDNLQIESVKHGKFKENQFCWKVTILP